MSPRAGLTRQTVIDAAAALADDNGLDALTLAGVAKALGVRTPSLYNHVDGLDDVRDALTRRMITDLHAAVRNAAVGRAGDDAIRAIARAYREFAHRHPGLYATLVPSAEGGSEATRTASHELIETVLDSLAAYGLGDDEALHATRTIRTVLHGFVSLELAGGFQLDLDVDATFDFVVDLLVSGLQRAAVTT